MLNIYCDESCHLENDQSNAMAIGAINIPRNLVKTVSEDIKRIKISHGISKYAEIKWTKVSPSKISFYSDLIKYFFNNDSLFFRAILIQNKQDLNHAIFSQTHDDWYYKMYYYMLRPMLHEDDTHIYMDIKDTNSAKKVCKLKTYLRNTIYDFYGQKITKMQLIRSEESQILQLVDLIIGAICYENRNLNTSQTKLALINLIKQLSRSNLKKSSSLYERKFNIFVWDPHYTDRDVVNGDEY
ncbi:DUF3800 domain-containing protein [Weizmannia sp. FSL K6-0777]|uniref:DUF3800 domain-containing protein n=1 Tax=Weizmannia sp. FSL K6-0777 TaxID=2954674 RepID=UPI0031593E05